MNWSKICTFVGQLISGPQKLPGAIYLDNTLMCTTVITHIIPDITVGGVVVHFD